MTENACPHPDQLRALKFGLPLPDDKLAQIAAHVASCPKCQVAFDAVPGDALGERIIAAAAAPMPAIDFPVGSAENTETDLPPQIPGFGPLQVLGHGGMGIVYKAEHLHLCRTVALKFIQKKPFARPDEVAAQVERFKREARNAATLHHPNIVTVLETGTHEGRDYIVMEYVDGDPLSKLSREAAWEEARRVATIARAVHYAHGRGVLHRDLKPANIILTRADHAPKIADFGLAKRLDEAESITHR